MFLISFFVTTGPNSGAWHDLGTVAGCEAAYDAYRKACDLAETVNARCVLIDMKTANIIADSADEIEE